MKTVNAIIGPPIDPYPVAAWSKSKAFGNIDWEMLWRICGSTVEKHIQIMPMWKVFVAVYFEGLMHGAGVQKDLTKRAATTWSDCG
jgi:hypothetical protein